MSNHRFDWRQNSRTHTPLLLINTILLRLTTTTQVTPPTPPLLHRGAGRD